ncbi:MAG: hypothetical protein IH629_05945, partial [Thermoleophilia bacterium]|nr:hypothetical protein [Thermoleophilia bacterium]
MMSTDHSILFRLKPIRAALVSEISETTSTAPVPEKDRVNFHIGNPLFDDRQISAFLRIVLGLNDRKEIIDTQDPDEILEILGWDPSEKPKLEFLVRAIKKSSPYMPRGGYVRQNPHPLIKAFHSWINQQQDP